MTTDKEIGAKMVKFIWPQRDAADSRPSKLNISMVWTRHVSLENSADRIKLYVTVTKTLFV